MENFVNDCSKVAKMDIGHKSYDAMNILNIPMIRQTFYYKQEGDVKRLTVTISSPYTENIGRREMLKMDVYLACDCYETMSYSLGTNIFALWVSLLVHINHLLKIDFCHRYGIERIYVSEQAADADDIANAINIEWLMETYLGILKEQT